MSKIRFLAALREEADCRERTLKGGTDSDGMEDAVTVDEGGSSGEVGTEVEKGKKRKVLRRERFSRRNEAYGASVNLLDVVRILKGLSKEDRGGASGRRRLMRSSLLCLVAAEGSHFTSATVLTPCG